MNELVRSEKCAPDAYRLIKRGVEYILQGAYFWQEGYDYGHNWRDIPTIIEEVLRGGEVVKGWKSLVMNENAKERIKKDSTEQE